MVAAAESAAKSRSTFRVRNLLTLVLSPILAEFVLSITVNSGWGWMIVLHLSACLGILAGAVSATIFRRAQSPLPKETESRDVS